MEYIEKKNGEVWLVTEHDVEGRHKTYSYLGKEYIEIEPKKIDKPKKGKNKKETE
jgi:hypothetical protein